MSKSSQESVFGLNFPAGLSFPDDAGAWIEHINVHTKGKIFISINEFSFLTGMPVQTIRNRIHNNKWPIPTRKEGSRRYMLSTDVALYFATSRSLLDSARKRGRPRKNPKAVHPLPGESG